MPPILHVSDLDRGILGNLRDAAATYWQETKGHRAFDDLQRPTELAKSSQMDGSAIAEQLRNRLLSQWASVRSLSRSRMPGVGPGMDQALQVLKSIPYQADISTAGLGTVEQMLHAFGYLTSCLGVGGVVASKMLSALRPGLFVMWDGAIATAYGFETTSAGYRRFLQLMAPAAQKIRELWGSGNGDLEDYLKPEGRAWRPTLAKALDEWHWVRITRGIPFGRTAKA